MRYCSSDTFFATRKLKRSHAPLACRRDMTIADRDVPHGWHHGSRRRSTSAARCTFEDEFVVNVRLEEVGRRSLRYAHEIVRAQTIVGTGAMVTVCVRTSEDGTMHAVELPGRRDSQASHGARW